MARIAVARARAAGARPPDRAPDAEAIALFVLAARRDEWAARYLLLRRMAAKMPHLSGRRLASYAGAALALDRLKATYHARRDCRALRIVGARAMRRQRDAAGGGTPYDIEVLAAAWAVVATPIRTAAMAAACGARREVRGDLDHARPRAYLARARATADIAAARAVLGVALDSGGGSARHRGGR